MEEKRKGKQIESEEEEGKSKKDGISFSKEVREVILAHLVDAKK